MLDTLGTDPQEEKVVGPLGTILWTLLIGVCFLLLQMLVMGIYAGATQLVGANPSENEMQAVMETLAVNGNVLALATIVSGVICTLLTLLAVRLKKGVPVLAYLGFVATDKAAYLKWGAIFIGLLVASEVILHLIGADSVPDVMIQIYQSASPKWWLWLAVIVIAPLFEEVFFRGFLFKGLSHTFLGVTGTIVVTAALWAVIHIQYELLYVGVIFVFGLVFGYARHKTGSVMIPLFLHILNNAISTVQMAHVV